MKRSDGCPVGVRGMPAPSAPSNDKPVVAEENLRETGTLVWTLQPRHQRAGELVRGRERERESMCVCRGVGCEPLVRWWWRRRGKRRISLSMKGRVTLGSRRSNHSPHPPCPPSHQSLPATHTRSPCCHSQQIADRVVVGGADYSS